MHLPPDLAAFLVSQLMMSPASSLWNVYSRQPSSDYEVCCVAGDLRWEKWSGDGARPFPWTRRRQ